MHSNRKFRERFCAMIVAMALCITVLPLNVFADELEDGVPPSPWKLAENEGKTLLTYEAFYSKAESEIGTLYKNIIEGGTDSNGLSFGGLDSSTPSHAYIAENLFKFIIVCDWIDRNMLYYNDKSSTISRINVFNCDDPNIQMNTLRGDILEKLSTIKSKINGLATDDKFTYGGPNIYALKQWVNADSLDVWTSSHKFGGPGTEQFEAIYSNGLRMYLQSNIVSILAQELGEDVCESYTTNGTSVKDVSAAIENYVKTEMLPTTGNTDPNPIESGGGNGIEPPVPDVSAPPTSESSPPEATTPVVNAEWPPDFNYTNSLLLGDTVLALIANNMKWASPEIETKDPNTYDSGGNLYTDDGELDGTGCFRLSAGGNHPLIAGCSKAYWDSQFPPGVEFSDVIGRLTSEERSSITDIYMMVGYDFASGYYSTPSGINGFWVDSGVDGSTVEEHLQACFNRLCTSVYTHMLNGGQGGGKVTRVTFFTQPLPETSNPYYNNVRIFNDNLETWVNEFNNMGSIPWDGVKFRVLPVSGSYSDIAGYWDNVAAAVKGAAEEEKKEEESKPPSGTTSSGNDATDMYNLYNKYREQLKDYYDVYEHINTYAGALFAYGYGEDRVGGVTHVGYFKAFQGGNLNTNSLVADCYEWGYLQDQNLGKPSGQMPGVNNTNVANAQSTLELISNATHSGYDVVVPDHELEDAELNEIGYICLAAGVVYDPFNSIAGNESYLEAVQYMLKDATDWEKIERLLQDAFSRKKPLYVLDGSKSKWAQADEVTEAPTGEYRFAYLADALQHDQATTRVYAVVHGGMEPSSVDSSTWEYATGGVTQTPSSTEASTESAAPTDNGVSIKSNGKSATVAGAQLMASPQQMSAPVMFTSGAKNGAWTGNWDGSASGYAASLGGLTTIIIHNAAQDAKSNSAIQAAETQMLFMNGLGDIVLADGTVILPAVANPAIFNYSSIQYDVDSSASWETAISGVITGAVVIGGLALAVPSGGASIPVVLGIAGAGAAGGTAGGKVIGSLADMWGDTSSSSEVQEIYDSTCGYYPYSAAFMNHYPAVIINSSGNLAVTNKNDEGKYVIGIDSAGNVLARRIKSLNNGTQVNLQYSGGGVTVATAQGLSFSATSNPDAIGTALPYVGGSDGTWTTKLNTARDFEYFMVKDTIYSSNDQSYFPLTDDMADLTESYLEVVGPMITSTYRFLTDREPAGETCVHHETFNVQKYIVDMCGEGLLGTQYGETLQKNYKISYDELVQDTGNRFLTFFVQLAETAIEHLGKIDGVLAIKNGYENSFFNMIVQFVQEFYLLIAVALLIIVAVKFIRGQYNMIFVMFIAALCVCGFEVYANWMPTVIPAAYNFAVNDSIEQITWNTAVVSAESYEETYKDSNRKDATTGALKPYTATLTLYKMTRDDMESVASRLGVSYRELKSGAVVYLDEAAGIFVQGDAIKISVDKLLVNNSMRGLFFTQWQELAEGFTESEEFITPITGDQDQVGNPYTVQLTQPYVSLEAYYMPFNEIERAFLINLNSFASLFRFERNQFSYGRNLYKDAFLFNCFTNSGIFTSPGDKEVLRENIKVGSVVGTYGADEDNEAAMLNRVYGWTEDDGTVHEGVFSNAKDWLNLNMVFCNPSTNMKTSLWGKTMQDRGWYDLEWNITAEGQEKLADLMAYMNEQTKQFVINNYDQLNFCSDENAIKIVSLYATTTFAHYTSQFGDWLYPNYLNAADIELRDVLYGSMTTLRDRNFSSDGTVVNTVAYNLGVFGVIFLLLITVFATLFVFVMTYLVPVLYAMFGAILIFKLINNKEGVGLVQGYVKVTGVTMLLYFIFSLSLRLVEVGGYAWYGYLGCALVMFLCCYFLFWVVLSVVQNAGEMGNDVLGQNLLRGMDAITRGAVRKLTTNTLHARRGIRGYSGYGNYGYGYGSPYQYGRGYGIDGRDYIRGSRRGFGFGRRGYNDPGYSSYGRGALYDDGMYEREGRHRVGNVIYGMFNRQPAGSRRSTRDSVDRSSRTQGGMSRYASRRR